MPSTGVRRPGPISRLTPRLPPFLAPGLHPCCAPALHPSPHLGSTPRIPGHVAGRFWQAFLVPPPLPVWLWLLGQSRVSSCPISDTCPGGCGPRDGVGSPWHETNWIGSKKCSQVQGFADQWKQSPVVAERMTLWSYRAKVRQKAYGGFSSPMLGLVSRHRVPREDRTRWPGCGGGWRSVWGRVRPILGPCFGPLRRALEPGWTRLPRSVSGIGNRLRLWPETRLETGAEPAYTLAADALNRTRSSVGDSAVFTAAPKPRAGQGLHGAWCADQNRRNQQKVALERVVLAIANTVFASNSCDKGTQNEPPGRQTVRPMHAVFPSRHGPGAFEEAW